MESHKQGNNYKQVATRRHLSCQHLQSLSGSCTRPPTTTSCCCLELQLHIIPVLLQTQVRLTWPRRGFTKGHLGPCGTLPAKGWAQLTDESITCYLKIVCHCNSWQTWRLESNTLWSLSDKHQYQPKFGRHCDPCVSWLACGCCTSFWCPSRLSKNKIILLWKSSWLLQAFFASAT